MVQDERNLMAVEYFGKALARGTTHLTMPNISSYTVPIT